ncbi:hypothetical protein OG762_30150 [Streptomyces sp. NBC_01136]|nr:hypothetical protein OG762_30150 [Streptomyces sp. NBC_01136]
MPRWTLSTLDLTVGATQVYAQIVRGGQGADLYDVFLKDYAPGKW